MKEIYIVKVDIECGRENIEELEGRTFPTISKFYNDKIVKDMENHGVVQLISLHEFTTDWNDTDDDADYLNPMEHFIGYVFIGE